MTGYVILSKNAVNSVGGDNMTWHEAGPPVEAVSAEAAIRKAVGGSDGGTYVAIPVRSFKPLTVTVETKRTVKVS
jgi:hypothetical protein